MLSQTSGHEEWLTAAERVCTNHRLQRADIRRSEYGENVVFFAGEDYVVKFFVAGRDQFHRERAALLFAEGKLPIATPRIVADGVLDGVSYLVMTQLRGVRLREIWPSLDRATKMRIVEQLGESMRRLHAWPAPVVQPALNRGWKAFLDRQARSCSRRQQDAGAGERWLDELPAFIADSLPLLANEEAPVMLHGDIHPGNLLAESRNDCWQLSGLFDFGDAMCGLREYDFVPPGVLMIEGDRELQRTLLLTYGYCAPQLNASFRRRLMLLTLLYECSNLPRYALRLGPHALEMSLEELERAIWPFANG